MEAIKKFDEKTIGRPLDGLREIHEQALRRDVRLVPRQAVLLYQRVEANVDESLDARLVRDARERRLRAVTAAKPAL